MIPVQMVVEEVDIPKTPLLVARGSVDIGTSISPLRAGNNRMIPSMSKDGYASRVSNWAIGRAAETAGVKVKEFVPGDRWTAWQRSRARIALGEEKKRLRMASKKTVKPKKKLQRN